jgi:23S rRNA (pseudouridine1915-N3)-methyltransferase
MHIRLLAVGERQPDWVDAGFGEYAARLPRHWKFRLDIIASANRGRGASADEAMAVESDKILAKLKPAEYVVVLDEKGRQFSSLELAQKVDEWQGVGHDVAFVIGGADGLSENCLRRGNLRWSLSSLTLPHGLARVLFAEQIYRAWSLNSGHPYHRE